MREMASHTQTLNANEKAELEAYAAANWGFMKNIINIDAFFSTGAPKSKGNSISQSKNVAWKDFEMRKLEASKEVAEQTILNGSGDAQEIKEVLGNMNDDEKEQALKHRVIKSAGQKQLEKDQKEMQKAFEEKQAKVENPPVTEKVASAPAAPANATVDKV